jgi:dTDP-4-dehydrorhamnose 3,5-epimerase
MDDLKKITQIDGVLLTPLKIIEGDPGSVRHAMKQSDPGFAGFGEAYFSTVNQGVVKGWKRHTQMVLNLVVIQGCIEFTAFDERPESSSRGITGSVKLSLDHYFRLTVPANVWLAFKGVSRDTNMLLNLASIEHNPVEAENRDLNHPSMPSLVDK